MTVVPTPEVTVGAAQALLGGSESIVSYVSPDGDVIYLNGGLAPVLGAQEGFSASKWKGLQAPGKPIESQGARQDGADWDDTVYDPLEIDFTVDIYGHTPTSFGLLHQFWFDAWSMLRSGGRIVWFTTTTGEWWINVRQGKEVSDELTFDPRPAGSASYQWVARTEGLPFWQSFDSTCEVLPTSATFSGFARLLNRGNLPAWPRYLLQGPFTKVTIGDAQSSGVVTFGPLAANQVVLITTMPRKRSVVELTSSTNLYPLLSGRFSTPINPVGTKPIWTSIPVSFTGATPGVTKCVAAVTPLRTYPE